jgi:ribosomal protein S18 acetylase RimI-like enzyme
MIVIRTATRADAKDVSTLLLANSADQDGQLYGDWSIVVVMKWITSGALVLIATEGPIILGVLFTSEKDQAATPPVIAMLKAWPGEPNAYVYGPICISQIARGRGVLEALYRELVARLPGREGILFIKRSNTRSLRAHVRLKMEEVSTFMFSGEEFVVLSTRPPPVEGRNK